MADDHDQINTLEWSITAAETGRQQVRGREQGGGRNGAASAVGAHGN